MNEMLEGYVEKAELNEVDCRLMIGLSSKVPTSSVDEAYLSKICLEKMALKLGQKQVSDNILSAQSKLDPGTDVSNINFEKPCASKDKS